MFFKIWNILVNPAILGFKCTTKENPRRQERPYQEYVQASSQAKCKAVDSPTMKYFKNRLDKFWQDQDLNYNFKAV